MGLFDFFNKNKKERERQEQMRLQQEAEAKRKAEEERKRQEQSKGKKAYLAIFSASWCGPSKRFINEIQQAGINNFTIIDVEKEQLLSMKYSIISVPTTLLLDEQGNIIKSWNGYDDEDPGQSKFVNYIKSSSYNILPYPEQRAVHNGEGKQGQFINAETLLSNFNFDSNCHQRYEGGNPVMGLQICPRYLKLRKNVNGCSGYQLEAGDGYILTATNGDTGKPQFAAKPMRVVKSTESEILLKGYPVLAQTPFGWQEIDLSDYGFSIILKNGKPEKCELHMYDRNVKLVYMIQQEKKEDNNKNSVSIKDIANGSAFKAHFTTIQVVKQPYNGDGVNIPVTKNTSIDIERNSNNGVVNITIGNIQELKSKGILQSNPSFNPRFNYSEEEGGKYQFAQAEVNNSWAMLGSDKEYISLFSVSRQNGKLIVFLINNLPHEDDYYYLIEFIE